MTSARQRVREHGLESSSVLVFSFGGAGERAAEVPSSGEFQNRGFGFPEKLSILS